MADYCQYPYCGGIKESPYHDPLNDDEFDHYFKEKNTMATKTTTPADPLAGLPVATPAAPKAAAPTPPTGGTVVNLAQHKKKRLTGQAYKDARAFARKATGYDETSPIWGKRMTEVLMEIESSLDLALTSGAIDSAFEPDVRRALEWNRELQKRIATGQLIGAQS